MGRGFQGFKRILKGTPFKTIPRSAVTNVDVKRKPFLTPFCAQPPQRSRIHGITESET